MKVEFDYHRKQIKSKNKELMLLLWVLMSVEYNIFLMFCEQRDAEQALNVFIFQWMHVSIKVLFHHG